MLYPVYRLFIDTMLIQKNVVIPFTKIAIINTSGKITMKGSGTTTITLTSKSISSLSIKVLVSSSSLTASSTKSKAGIFYFKNASVYDDGASQVLAGNYVKK
jgi:hypothetical protein